MKAGGDREDVVNRNLFLEEARETVNISSGSLMTFICRSRIFVLSGMFSLCIKEQGTIVRVTFCNLGQSPYPSAQSRL